MDDASKIFIEQLRDGRTEKIDEQYDPAFLDIHEKELTFEELVVVKGEAYLAENDLILHLEINTFAKLPCPICNEMVKAPIHVHNFYHNEPLESIKSRVFNMMHVLREAVLLETPSLRNAKALP